MNGIPMPHENAQIARPLLSLVICTLDEAASIGGVLREVDQVLADVTYEILVVDDSANDDTATVVLAHAAVNPRIRLARRQHIRGLASAAIAGWDAARGEILGIMDGDGQHDPAILREMLERLVGENADLAVASRYAAEGPSGLTGFRHLVSRSGTRLTHLVLGAGVTDPLSGLFLMRRSWFEVARPRLSGAGFKILVDLIGSSRRRPKTVEVATALRERTGGRSKLDARVIFDLAALLAEKRTGGLLPARFTLFAAVGATGVLVHLTVLGSLRTAVPDGSFWTAQAAAIMAAMTWNFFLNNALTFRDMRLAGRGLWLGLLAFYGACAGGALLNEAIAGALARVGAHWALAGVAGALAGAVWNYCSTRQAAWGAKASTQAAQAPASHKAIRPL